MEEFNDRTLVRYYNRHIATPSSFTYIVNPRPPGGALPTQYIHVCFNYLVECIGLNGSSSFKTGTVLSVLPNDTRLGINYIIVGGYRAIYLS